ncbi:MAG: cysteine desulfurase [Planctomycetota bacterium]|nr:cysteine desulfurase [Planctomycetota bacterium]
MKTASQPTSMGATRPGRPSLDLKKIREDFPILGRTARGKPLVYLDNAATSQKPQAVIDAMSHYYSSFNANVHRGVHQLSEEATKAYEGTRDKIREHINARDRKEIIFVRGTTEATNLVAQTYGRKNVAEGDEVIITTMEHHSNIVPWQILCEEKKATLRVVPITDEGELILEEYEKMLGPKTRLVSVVHVSNSLGTINPARKIVELAHRQGIPVLLDGAQALPHFRVDVQDLDCDFYAFSGHKMFGPTGIGILYGKLSLLEEMPPYQTGGDMIKSVTFEKTLYNELPYRFEAGTPIIAGVVGLGAAVDYLRGLDPDAVVAHEQDLLRYATREVSAVPGVRLVGTAKEKGSVLSMLMEGVHPHDIGTILDHEGIAIRAGHHCTQPLMQRFGVDATARASFAFYNTREEVDALVAGLHKVAKVFG